METLKFEAGSDKKEKCDDCASGFEYHLLLLRVCKNKLDYDLLEKRLDAGESGIELLGCLDRSIFDSELRRLEPYMLSSAVLDKPGIYQTIMRVYDGDLDFRVTALPSHRLGGSWNSSLIVKQA